MGIGRIGAGIGLFVASRASEARGVLDGTKEICVWRILSGPFRLVGNFPASALCNA